MPNVWNSLSIFLGTPKSLDHFSGSAVGNTYGLSLGLRLAPCHSCSCLWWSPMAIGISQMQRSSLQLDCAFTSSLVWAVFRNSDPTKWYQVSTSLQDPSNPGASTSAGTAHSPMASYVAKPQVFSMTMSCLQNQNHLCALPSFAASTRHSPCTLCARASGCWFWGNTPRNFCLNDDILVLITSDCSIPASQYQLPKQRFYFLLLQNINWILW